MNSSSRASRACPQMDKAEALLPCPFCGSTGEEVAVCYSKGQTPASGRDWFVRCYVCHVETPSDYDVAADAVAAWNRRAHAPDRETLIDAVMLAATDEVVADGWQALGKPNVLVQGCRFIRGHARGYEKPEAAAREFAGFIVDAIVASQQPQVSPSNRKDGASKETTSTQGRGVNKP